MINLSKKHLSKGQALEYLVHCIGNTDKLLPEDEEHSFHYNEWFEAQMYQLMRDIIKSEKPSFSVYEIEYALVGYAIGSGSYTIRTKDETEKDLFESKYDLAVYAIMQKELPR